MDVFQKLLGIKWGHVWYNVATVAFLETRFSYVLELSKIWQICQEKNLEGFWSFTNMCPYDCCCRLAPSSMHLCFSQMWKQRQHGEHWTHFFPCFYRQEAAFWEPEPHQEEPNEKFQDVVPIIFTLGFQQGKEVFFFFIMILHTVCYRVSHIRMFF